MKVNGTPYRSIWYEDGEVRIIDQRWLPHDFRIATLKTRDDFATAIRDMWVRGAPLIGATAAYGMAEEMARDPSDANLSDAWDVLHATRPTAINLKWALEVKRALDNGLDGTLRELQSHRQDIEALPDTGVPGELRNELSEDLSALSERLKTEEFFKHSADFSSLLTHVKGRVREAVISLSDQQKLRIKEGAEELQRVPEWGELTQEERGSAIGQLDGLELTASHDLAGLRKLLARDYDISSTIDELRRSIQRQGQERIRQRIEDERAEKGKKGPARFEQSVSVPTKMTTAADLDAPILKLNEIKAQLALYDEIEVSFSFGSEE